jgi:hypothetical protein
VGGTCLERQQHRGTHPEQHNRRPGPGGRPAAGGCVLLLVITGVQVLSLGAGLGDSCQRHHHRTCSPSQVLHWRSSRQARTQQLVGKGDGGWGCVLPVEKHDATQCPHVH